MSSSTLTNLPPEMRNAIYEAVIVATFEPLGPSFNNAHLKADLGLDGRPASHPLAQVCRLTRKEFTPMWAVRAVDKAIHFTARVADFHFDHIHWLLKRPADPRGGSLKVYLNVTCRPCPATAERTDEWFTLCQEHFETCFFAEDLDGAKMWQRPTYEASVTCPAWHFSHADVKKLVMRWYLGMRWHTSTAEDMKRALDQEVDRLEGEVWPRVHKTTGFFFVALAISMFVGVILRPVYGD